MPQGLTPQQVRRSLTLSIVDGALWAVMVGASESYLGALAVELGHQDTSLALLTTVPILLGALSQLGASWLADAVGGRRRLVVVGAVLQALTLVGLWWLAAHQVRELGPFLLFRSLYWVLGAVIGPAWSAWMATLTREVSRERYFAWRNAVIHLALLAVFLLAGRWLGGMERQGATLAGFASLQLVALGARVLSALCLGAQSDLPAGPVLTRPGPGRFRRALRQSRWSVAVYFALVQMGAHVAIPFFTPYMRHDLQLDLDAFAWLVAVSILGKALSFPLWGQLARRFGLRPVLLVSGVGVAVIPTLWAWVTDPWGLGAVQAVSGVVWAGMELASSQLLLESAPDEVRLEFLSLQSSLAGVLALLGSLAGSALRERLAWSYLDLFLLSGLARALPLLLLLSAVPGGVRPLRRLFFRVLSVRPGGGAVREPVVPLEEPPPRE